MRVHFLRSSLYAGPLVTADVGARPMVGGAVAVDDDREVAADLFKCVHSLCQCPCLSLLRPLNTNGLHEL